MHIDQSPSISMVSQIGNKQYRKDQVELMITPASFDNNSFFESGEWAVEKMETYDSEKTDFMDSADVVTIRYFFHMKRKFTYYMMNIIGNLDFQRLALDVSILQIHVHKTLLMQLHAWCVF